MQIKLYNYEDLDSDGQSKARDEIRVILPDEWIYDDTLEDLVKDLSKRGYPDAKINHQVHGQGAGASFACQSVALPTLVHRMLVDDVPDRALEQWRHAMTLLQTSFGVAIRVKKANKGAYAGDMYYFLADAGVHDYFGTDEERPFTKDEIYEMLDRMKEWVKEDAEELARKIYNDLWAAWSASIDDESLILDYVEANSFLFTRSGKMATQELLEDAS